MRKQVHESRWTLGLSSAVLFGLGWLFVWVTSLNESRILRDLGDEGADGRVQDLENHGDRRRVVVTVVDPGHSWNHPFIFLLISVWAIGRGSAAVAAEVDAARWTCCSRGRFRAGIFCLGDHCECDRPAVLAGALIAGASIAVHYNVASRCARALGHVPARGQSGGLGLPIYGYTLLASAARSRPLESHLDRERLTLAGFVALVISLFPVLKEMIAWGPWSSESRSSRRTTRSVP